MYFVVKQHMFHLNMNKIIEDICATDIYAFETYINCFREKLSITLAKSITKQRATNKVFENKLTIDNEAKV